ncbi:MAG TPA: YfiR family protein [Blastocatellia bacterium]|nr:YfiR family protein [Blastocatellia bacterium]
MEGTIGGAPPTSVRTGLDQGQLFWRRLPVPIVKVVRLLLIAALAVASPDPNGNAQTQPASVSQIKAAYLYNFAKLVEWPADAFKDADSPVVLGLVGDEPFGEILDQNMAGRKANGRKVVIVRLKASDNLRACHLLFISASEKSRVPQILAGLKGANVLTVAEIPHFAQSGGIINFFQEEKRVQFEINVEAAERAKLKISSRLLSLAKLVKDEPHGGRV